jgi:putative transposase
MMLACDFFHVDWAVTLKRISVFFVLEVGTRAVHLLGMNPEPGGGWTTQQIRNLMRDLGEGVTPLPVPHPRPSRPVRHIV